MNAQPFFLFILSFSCLTAQAALRDEASATRTRDLQQMPASVNLLTEVAEGYQLEHPKYRVLFDSAGPSFTPAQGPNWTWRLAEVTSGGSSLLQAEQKSAPARAGSRMVVDYDRTILTERYILKAHTIEQQFVLQEPCNNGTADLIIAGEIHSEGTFEPAEQGWNWRTASGVISLGKVTVFDVDGRHIPAHMTVTAASSQIVVDGAALALARYPVTVDPEIGTEDFRISTTGTDGDAAFDAFDPAVAYNSSANEYLVVWSGDAAGNDEFEIFGQRLDAESGDAIGGNFRISDMGPDGDTSYGAFAPAVAFSTTSNQYLVVWYGDDNQGSLSEDEFEIFGQLLNSTGGEVGSNDFRISDMGADGNANFDAFNPAVVYNSTEDQFLVVWHGDNSGAFQIDNEFEIFGQRINAATGAELGANDFQISNMGFSSDTAFEAKDPDVAYNSSNNQYLVVWRGDESIAPLVNDEFEIFGQRLDGTLGSVVGNNDFRISDMGPNGNTAYAASNPGVAYNVTRNEYLVVWTGDDDTSPLVNDEFEVFGQRIDAASGTEVGDNDFRISDLGPDGDTDYAASRPDIAYNPIQGEYLVAWHGDDNAQSLENNRFEIFAQLLSGIDGIQTGINDFLLSSMSTSASAGFGAFQASVVHNAGEDEFLTVWHGSKNAPPLVDGETEIFGQRFTTKVTPNIFTVTNTDNAGAGSLRQALLDANATANASAGSPDRIEFDIPTSDPGFDQATGSFNIQPQTDLPTITDTIILDGLTQPSAHCDSWPPQLLIELDGSAVNAGGQNGLVLDSGSDNSTVRGLVVNNFQNNGISIFASSNNLLECNFLGTDVTGTSAAGNLNGIAFEGNAGNNQIGGVVPSSRNLVSGNSENGITTSDADNFNVIQGNFVGTSVTGVSSLGNGQNGIYLWNSSSNNLIGGTTAGAANTISGNSAHGIRLEDFANDNQILGNLIGTDSTGTLVVANAGSGIMINADAVRNEIGGASASARNIISGNGGNGILLDFGADSNTIAGNFIGLAQDGISPLGNALSGVHIMGSAEDNRIGGTSLNAGNRIAFNQEDGVRMAEQVIVNDTFLPSSNSVLSNSIHSNGGLAINLDGDPGSGTDVVTPNDANDADAGPNGLLNFPVLNSAILNTGTLTVDGSFNGIANTSGIRLEFFANTVCNGDANGLAQTDPFGEGETFLGSSTISLDGLGNTDFTASFPFPVGGGDFITATATALSNTSEFAQCVEVTSVQVATLTFTPTDDGQVKLASSENFGDKATAKVESDKFRTYLKFNVTGLFNTVLGVRLRMRTGDGADDGSDVGGIAAQASNDFSDRNDPWNEEELIITNAPDVLGGPLDILGPVQADTFVEFNLGTVVQSDGTYSFCITSNSNDQVKYLMKEGISPPELLVDVATTVDNLVPEAKDDVLVTQVNQPATIDVTANDVDFDGQVVPASVAIVVQPSNGTASIDSAGVITYTPAADFTGSDSFEYTVEDDDAAVSSQATVNITVTPPNSAPTAVNDNITGQQDTPVNIAVLSNDSDSDGTLDVAAVTIVTPPGNGTALVNTGNGLINYSPANGFFGVDQFSYTVRDNFGALSNEATVFISVKKGAQLNVVEFLPTDDGQVKHTDLVANYGDKATMKIEAGKFTSYLKFNITGLVGEIQDVKLRLRVSDGQSDGGSSGGSLHVVSANFSNSGTAWNEAALNFQNAPAINTPPLATLGSVNPDTFVEFDVTNIVTGDGIFSFALSSAISNEVKYYTRQHATFSPALVVEILGPPGNTEPIAADDDTLTTSGQAVTINLTQNDVDLDGILDLDAVLVQSPPGNGTVQIAAGTGNATYTSFNNFSGLDTFTYTVRDNEGATSNAATVTIDVRDNSQWSTLGSGLNGPARALAGDALGNIYAVGDFTEAGGNAANGVAMWDGQDWSALGAGLDPQLDPQAIVINNSDVFVGGVGGVRKWDGNSWSNLADGPLQVHALAVIADTLFAGGAFASIGGVSANNIAQFDGQDWLPLAQGVDAPVNALTLFQQNLVAGGLFTQADGVTVNRVAIWNGSTWQDLAGGLAGSGPLIASLNATTTQLFAGGLFTTAGATDAQNLAIWNGSTWSALGQGSQGQVLALANTVDKLFAAAEVVFGGERVAKWDGQLWQPLGTGVNDTAHAVISTGRHVYFAGHFTEAGGLAANHIARWTEPNQPPVATNDNAATEIEQPVVIDVPSNDFDADGSLDLGSVAVTSPSANGTTSVEAQTGKITYTPNAGFTGSDTFEYRISDNDGTPSNPATVAITISPIDNSRWSALGEGVNVAPRAIAIDGAHVYVGGTFTTAGGQSIQKIAKWDGATWSAPGNGSLLPNHATVFGLAAGDSGLFIGGDFTSVNGQAIPYLARFHSNTWSMLGTGVNNRVNAVALIDSNVYAGGVFSSAGGNPASRVARWDGSGWSALGSGLNGTVLALAVEGSNLYAGGHFTQAGGVSAEHIARWDGANWTPLGAGVNNIVTAIAVDGGNLFAVGNFTQAGGSAANRIAMWDGTSWSPLAEGLNDDGHAVAAHNGEVFVTGRFTQAGLTDANRIAKWNGASWMRFGSGLNNTGWAIASNGTDVYVGGDFTQAGGKAASKIALWGEANLAPVAQDDAANTEAEVPVIIGVLANDFDPDGTLDTTSISVTSPPAGGTLVLDLQAGTVTYTSNPGFVGQDSFLYTVRDNRGGVSNQATVTVTIPGEQVVKTFAFLPIHDGQVKLTSPSSNYGDKTTAKAENGKFSSYFKFDVTGIPSVVQRATLQLKVADNASDASESGGTVFSVSNNFSNSNTPWDESSLNAANAPQISGNGLQTLGPVQTATIVNFDVTSAVNGNGVVSFGLATSSNDQVKYLTKEGVSPPQLLIEALTSETGVAPVAHDDTLETVKNIPGVIIVLENDEDPDGALDPTTVTVKVPPANGTVGVNPNSGVITYTPNSDFSGQDLFSYTVQDNQGIASNEASVTVIVENPVVTPPSTLAFGPTDDGQVKLNGPGNNYGDKSTAKVESDRFAAYFKFNVSGITGSVQTAVLRLTTGDAEFDGSLSGGSLFLTSNNFDASNEAWTEAFLTAGNAPGTTGGPLGTLGTVQPNTTVEFDVSAAIAADGVFSFVLTSTSADQVKYYTKEGTVPPSLIIETGGNNSAAVVSELAVENQTTLDAEPALPTEFNLGQNYPNPFNASTTIHYALPEDADVKLQVYNIMGQLVTTLVDENQKAGFRSVRWLGKNQHSIDVSSGIYFVRLEANKHRFVNRVLLQK